jgi:hypothetical protein
MLFSMLEDSMKERDKNIDMIWFYWSIDRSSARHVIIPIIIHMQMD